jgi:tetratricopeptide (TPR) repeat protein
VGDRTATALGDVVQSEAVEAAMLLQLGKLDDAERVLSSAMHVLVQEPQVPKRWIPQIQILQARAAELAGKLERAQRLLGESIEIQRSLFTESKTEGFALLALGRVYSAQGREQNALSAFRQGFALLGSQGVTVSYDDVYPFFSTALSIADRDLGQRQLLFTEMLEVAQMVQGPVTAETMALATTRLASSEAEVGALIRALQDAHRRRDGLLETITIARADPTMLAPQITELEAEWSALNTKVADLERQIQAAAPRYNQLIDKPVSVEDVLGSLGPGEALVQILVGTQGGTGFIVDS